MSLTPDDIRAIVRAFDESDWLEMSLQHGDTHLEMSRTERRTLSAMPSPSADSSSGGAALPAALDGLASPPVVTAPQFESAPRAETSSSSQQAGSAPDGVRVTAPTVGLFWASPQPGAPPFVEVGQRVGPDDTVCIVEVMKLMSHVKAGIAGTVMAISVANGAMVEHGDTLIIISPEG